jgi:membrane protein
MARSIWNLLQLTVARWTRNDGNLLAASMAYYAAFSFFPLLMVLISALGFALQFSASAQGAQQQLFEFLAQHTAPALAEQVQEILSEVKTRAPYSGPIGLVTLLLGAIGIFSQLESAFDRLWHETTPHSHGVWGAIRNALWNRLKAFLTLIALGLVMFAAFVAELMFTALRTWAEDLRVSNAFWQWNQLAFNAALNAAVFSLLYKLIPRAPVRWSHAVFGGMAVAVVWQVGSQLVARFIVGGNYSAYGVVGSFIAMMLWVYCASIVLFLGAQFVQVLGHPDENNSTLPRAPNA